MDRKPEKTVGFVETPQEIARLMVQLSTVPRSGHVIDTGCGRGVFLGELELQGFHNVAGIEIDRKMYQECMEKFRGYHILNGDFLTCDFREKFDLVIGNPPYAHFNQLPPRLARTVRKIINTSEGDIYYAFILRAIDALKDNGELIYIVPYHFMYNTFAKIVRKTLLENGSIELIIDLDEVPIFHGERPEIIIFKFVKGKKPSGRIKVLRIRSRNATPHQIHEKALDALRHAKSNELFDFAEIPHFNSAAPWSTFVMTTPEFPYALLKDIARVGVGPVTGFDRAFIVSEKDLEQFNDDERKLVMNFIKAKNCQRYITRGYVKYILVPDRITSENMLRAIYPHVHEKLIRFKDELSWRYIPRRKKWFHWQALRNLGFLLANFSRKRIYVPVLDRHKYNRFSLGKECFLPAGDVLFIQAHNERDMLFLLGYLNTDFFRRYYLAHGGRRGGRIAFTQRLLENTHIPLFREKVRDQIIAKVKKIIEFKSRGKETKELESEIEELVLLAIKKRMFGKKWIEEKQRVV